MLDNEFNKNEVQVLKKPNMSQQMGLASTMGGPFAEVSSTMAMPDTPKGGVLVKVKYAGACYNEGQMKRRGVRPRFPGYEISGVIHDVCNTIPNCNYTPGDQVILFPDEHLSKAGYVEYIPVDDTRNVLQIPSNMNLEVAAMLPGGALSAYAAILSAKPHVEKLQAVKPCVNVLIVGAGGLGLWTLRIAKFIMGDNCSNVRMFVADNSIDKLLTAQEHECYDIIHWNEEDHEEYIIERTLDACRGGVDVIIDFVSSSRTMSRSLKVLNREGLILVGGNSLSDVSISLNALAAKQQSIVGIPKGNMNQLQELVDAVSQGKLQPPLFNVFNVDEASKVFEDLSECRITGRAIFRFANSNSTSVTDN